jgi:SagB-type dehydrogenase family enzyme
LPAPKKARGRKVGPVIAARLNGQVTLTAVADGSVVARFGDYAQGLGKFSPATLERLHQLRTGLPLGAVGGGRATGKDIEHLIRRLALSGLLEYRFGPAHGRQDQVVIEPQMAEYWPKVSKIGNADTLVLSRFAYLRRRGEEMVVESPRAGALFRIADPKIAAALATLAQPQKISRYRKERGFPGLELLGLLLDCEILFKLKPGDAAGLRPSEGDPNLVLWDFHDLLFHTRSTNGRQANPIGGLYSYASVMPPLPAVRAPWPGKSIDLNAQPPLPAPSPFAQLLHERHSTRDFEDGHPITLAELAAFLQTAARIRAQWTSEADPEHEGPQITYAARPYPSAGAAYELELYLAVANCAGLASGFYHYDAGRHALTLIESRPQEVEAQLSAAAFAIGAADLPQILITMAARFGRVSWKYNSVAYSLILKDVGALMQTLYLTAADMGLGGCAIGTNDIDLFAKMTGLEFYVEGPVGQFALGRGRQPANGPQFG